MVGHPIPRAQVIAKCETRQSLFNFKSIAGAADGIILSRGNLGLDVLPEKMALVQKSVISNCNLLGKPIIITRVVDTMCVAPRPTRCAALRAPPSRAARARVQGAARYAAHAACAPPPSARQRVPCCAGLVRRAALNRGHAHVICAFELCRYSAQTTGARSGSTPTRERP